MKTQFTQLLKEIANFNHSLSFSGSPADSDFQNACQLFNNYLNERFDEFNIAAQEINKIKETKNLSNEIMSLKKLLSMPDHTTKTYTQWAYKLSNYCKKQTNNTFTVTSS